MRDPKLTLLLTRSRNAVEFLIVSNRRENRGKKEAILRGWSG